VSDVISEVVLGSFWLMLPGLGPNSAGTNAVVQHSVFIDLSCVESVYGLRVWRQTVVFFVETFRSFLLRHFVHGKISVISLTVVLKLAVTVFLSYIFRHSD